QPAELIADRTDSLEPVVGGAPGKLTIPEVMGHRVLTLADNVGAVTLISEHAVDVEQGRMLGIQTSAQCMVENKLKPGTPGVTKETLKALHEKIGGDWSIIRRQRIDQIPGKRILQVTGIKVHHLVTARAWNGVHNGFGKIAV